MKTAMNEAWREILPHPDVRKYVQVKRTDELVLRFPGALPELIWCNLPTKGLTSSVGCP